MAIATARIRMSFCPRRSPHRRYREPEPFLGDFRDFIPALFDRIFIVEDVALASRSGHF